MDFGKILDQWESQNPHKAVDYKDKCIDQNTDKNMVSYMSDKEVEKIPVDDKLDLHGMTIAEAEIALENFFHNAERDAYRKVIIVHGKGLHSDKKPVLTNTVNSWLKKQKAVMRFGHTQRASGGVGATWVLLKRRKN